MTTLNLPPATAVFDRLDALRSRRWALGVLAGGLAFLALALGGLLAATLLAGYWPSEQPPTALRWALLIGLCLLAALAAGWFLVRPLVWRQNPAQLARFAELALPEIGNDLINSVLLSGDPQPSSPEMVELALREALVRTRSVDLNRSVSTKALRGWAIAAAACATLTAVLGFAQGGVLRRGMLAIFSPGRYVPVVNRLELLSIAPEDNSTRLAGQGLTIVATIKNEPATPYDAEVILDGLGRRPMLPSDGYGTYAYALNVVDQTLRFAVRIGASRWPADKPWYTVNVLQRVEVQGLDLRYDYPAYTRLPGETKAGSDGKIVAPMGSRTTVVLRLAAPVPSAVLELKDASSRAMSTTDSGMSFSATLPVQADGAYRIVLQDASGKTIQQLPDSNGHAPADSYGSSGQDLLKGYFPIRALPDDPPKIEFVHPGRDLHGAPGGKTELKLRLIDQYGLTAAALMAGLEGQEPRPAPGFPAMKPGKNDQALDYMLDLAPYKKGDVVVYYATATDNREMPGMGPQTTISEKYKITVQDAGELAAEKAKRWEDMRRRLMALLKIEEAQRVNCEIVVRDHDNLVNSLTAASTAANNSRHTALGKRIQTLSQAMFDAQRGVRAELVDLATNFAYDEDTDKLRGEIASLAGKEASLAVEQARTLTAMKLTDKLARQAAALASTQNKIISSLQTLLAVMPSLAGKKAPGDKAASRPSDLTPEARDKLKALKSDLEKMIEEQKKVIAAGDRLSKKPVDAFTEDDEKVLQDLKATQDKWEKFLNEAFADFSKLAQQDFSNPVMMKELISVKSDITMAKDALSKKAAEIATALEDNGIENAKTLTANIEKWLPDVPDREKWSMEDPGNGQTNTEQAELPKELEDLVGDLLEKEEDLFDEMQDQTAKYNQSGDKGIGWDATDGPISNMNAQGVTGNQLPNKDELSGRSGEGRSGKSTGEFVEDKYVGKGGRRTPTRLTPEPFQKGEVKDESGDPAGGSTGGGKVGGAGGEGLEGPVPPPLAKEMKRLAGKQAALLNKAERVSAKFSTNDAANIKLIESITLMSRVKADLESFRYRNVLRARKETLGALSQSKLLLSGQIDVSNDTSVSMPKYIMDDISDAMKGNLPEEFREVLQQYYKRLSEQPRK